MIKRPEQNTGAGKNTKGVMGRNRNNNSQHHNNYEGTFEGTFVPSKVFNEILFINIRSYFNTYYYYYLFFIIYFLYEIFFRRATEYNPAAAFRKPLHRSPGKHDKRR